VVSIAAWCAWHDIDRSRRFGIELIQRFGNVGRALVCEPCCQIGGVRRTVEANGFVHGTPPVFCLSTVRWKVRLRGRASRPVFKHGRHEAHQLSLPGIASGCQVGTDFQFDPLACRAILLVVGVSPFMEDAQALCLGVELEIPTVRIVPCAVTL